MSNDYRLAYGAHASPDDGRCAMEWVSYLAGEPHSDQPRCVSPVMRAFCIALNDGLEESPRQRLRPYLARTIGTAGDGIDATRAWLALDWLIRTHTPTWLAAAGLHDGAGWLRSLARFDTAAQLPEALAVLERARADATDASGHRTITWRATAVAVRAAAREAAWSTPAAAAWAAARLGIGELAADRARALARTVATEAATRAARDAASSVKGRAAAKRAARAALEPTVRELERSAFELLDQLLPTVALGLPTDAGAPPSRVVARA